MPIPFFGELGSINPIVALPPALESQGEELAKALAPRSYRVGQDN